jgi:hypothetical protein
VNTPVVSKPDRRFRVKERPPFRTVLIYQDLTAGESALNFYEKLTRRFEEDFDFSHLMWSFSLLSDPETLLSAARSAANAHLVILSFTGNSVLPADVKDWARHWVKLGQDQRAALVTLVDHEAESGTLGASYSFLRRIIAPRKIDFFPHRAAGSALRLSRPE